MEDDDLCQICSDRVAEIELIPCKHNVCKDCGGKMQRETTKQVVASKNLKDPYTKVTAFSYCVCHVRALVYLLLSRASALRRQNYRVQVRFISSPDVCLLQCPFCRQQIVQFRDTTKRASSPKGKDKGAINPVPCYTRSVSVSPFVSPRRTFR